jgi:spore germination cell wall hydrolase CwlJ-like protein
MMRLACVLSLAVAALTVAAAPAATDTTLSQANAPAPSMAPRLAALLGAEHDAVAALPPGALDAPAGKAGPAPAAIRYEADWLAAQSPAMGGRDWECLARAVYFEARGETIAGRFAVAEVVLNRVDSPAYPSSVCAVVNQRGSGGCQFSFTCDGIPDRIDEAQAWREAGAIAGLMLAGAPRVLTQGATHFHTHGVRPGWAHRFPRTAAIGAHLFYRQPVVRVSQ